MLISFDLEGPLSPNDNAYELMSLAPQGARVFEVISRYDDLLTLEGKPDYEPGDTLSLIVPFLLYYGFTEQDIHQLAEKASLTPGAKELVGQLQSEGWRVLCITTTYEPYALPITSRVGIPRENVAATPFPLNQIRQTVPVEELAVVEKVVRELIGLSGDAQIKSRLDRFWWELPPSLAEWRRRIKPVGGRRKLEALRRLAPEPLSRLVVVGDSITDSRLLEAVDKAGGLAVAFNANEYALPYATVGLASSHLLDLYPVVMAWARGGRPAVREVIRPGEGERGHLHWLKEGEIPLALHQRLRRLLRSRAAELG